MRRRRLARRPGKPPADAVETCVEDGAQEPTQPGGCRRKLQPDPEDPDAEEEPAPVYAYYPGCATIHDGSAWLTIQKLEGGAGSINAPPDTTGLAWDPGAQEWVVADPVANADVFAPYTPPGFPAAYTAELNVGGKLILGHVWNLKRMVMTEGVTKDGWWRLTFSTDSGLINLTGSTLLGPPPAPGTAETAEEGETTLSTPVIVSEPDITCIDVYIAAAKGGGKRL